MNLLATQLDAKGAGGVAARLRHPDQRFGHTELRKAAQFLFVEGNPDAARRELELAQSEYYKGLKTIRENLNPLQAGTIVVPESTTLFNVTVTSRPGPPSFESEVVEWTTAQALEAATLWALAFDGPQAKRVLYGDRAFRLAVQVEALVDSADDWTSERPAARLPAITHLLKPFREGLPIEPDADFRFDRLASVAQQFAHSGTLSGSVDTRDSALQDFRIIFPDAKNGLPGAAFDLWISPSVRLSLTRAMIRHGQVDEAGKCLHELASVGTVPEVLVIEADFNRRNGRPQAVADEKSAIETWKTMLAATNPNPNDIRAAVASFRGFMSQDYRQLLLPILTGLGKNEDNLKVLLDAIGTDRLPQFDDFLAELLKSEAASRLAETDSLMSMSSTAHLKLRQSRRTSPSSGYSRRSPATSFSDSSRRLLQLWMPRPRTSWPTISSHVTRSFSTYHVQAGTSFGLTVACCAIRTVPERRSIQRLKLRA